MSGLDREPFHFSLRAAISREARYDMCALLEKCVSRPWLPGHSNKRLRSRCTCIATRRLSLARNSHAPADAQCLTRVAHNGFGRFFRLLYGRSINFIGLAICVRTCTARRTRRGPANRKRRETKRGPFSHTLSVFARKASTTRTHVNCARTVRGRQTASERAEGAADARPVGRPQIAQIPCERVWRAGGCDAGCSITGRVGRSREKA